MNVQVNDFGKRQSAPVRTSAPDHVFQPGDMVRCVHNYGRPLLYEGQLYTIASRTATGYYELKQLGTGHVFAPYCFELVSRAAPPRVPRFDAANNLSDVAKPTEAMKHDAGKVPLHLLDPLFLEATAKVLAFGEQKYAAWNWALGTFKWSRLFSACLRHLWAFWRGEELDEESGMPHLWHAACCLMFMIRYSHSKLGTDDRHVFKDVA
ncbi:MAG TPA: dATP/dGTP diphosphohydrolase domain-containing protein [Ktedonobacterales bacterium]|nr:dATP/dGTP diphosphohydrolase domain-containing protein [Ktedonobacterales bacterium]